MKKTTLFFAVIFVFFSSCRKELDLSSNNIYGVRELLRSQNCHTKCGTSAQCENKTIRLQGVRDDMNYFPDQNRFFLNDADNDNYYIECVVDSAVSTMVFAKFSGYNNEKVNCRGFITGYDAPMNFKCERHFICHIGSADDVEIVK